MAYKLGNVQFGNFLTKEVWVLQGTLLSLEYILLTSLKILGKSEIDLLRLSIRTTKSQIKRLQKKTK